MGVLNDLTLAQVADCLKLHYFQAEDFRLHYQHVKDKSLLPILFRSFSNGPSENKEPGGTT